MDPGRENSSNLLLDSAKFKSVDTISINERHPQELIKCILEHEASGTPLVLTGLDSCTSWPSVIPQLLRRDCFTTEGRRERNNRAYRDVSALLKELSFFSNYLLSDQTATYPLILGDLRCEVGHVGRGQAFQQTHCAATFQQLVLDSAEQAPYVWFISEAASAKQVAEHLLRIPPSALMCTAELLSCPFLLYTHRQSIGDLLILPPRCHAQSLQNGEVSFVSWSRMSHYGLELAIYHELPMYRRLCHPERYGIREMIHKALVTHTTALDSPPVPEQHALSIQHISKWLRTLLQLFDDVLLEGYCTDHESLDFINCTPREPVCHFCGSCLFLSCFRCVGGCSDSDRDPSPGDSPICICPTCYVEGRTCGCGDMDPERLSSLSRMLQDRNRAAEVLSKFHLAQGIQTPEFAEISEGYFLWPRVAVFQAAKELWKLRKSPDDRKGKTCTPRGKERSHPAPSASLINCKKCHAAKCFFHILQAQVHSSEALLATAADSNSVLWHQLHQTARQRSIISSDDPTTFLNNPGRLVFYATKFSIALALGPATSAGFYDTSNPISAELGSSLNPAGNCDSSIVPPIALTSGAGVTNSPADVESLSVPSPQTSSTLGQTADVNVGTSRSEHKRGRSPESEDSECMPNKRPRFPRNSTRTLRYTSSHASVATVVSADAPTRLRRRRTEGPADTSFVHANMSRFEDPPGHTPVNQPTDLPLDSDQTVPRSRRASRTPSMNSIRSKFASMDKSVPVAFTFFNPTTDLPVTASSNGAESFSNLLLESSASRLDQPLAYQRDNRPEVHSRRDRQHTSSRIGQAATYHWQPSRRKPPSAAWDPFLRPPAADTASSSLRVGAYLGGDIQQPQTGYTPLGVASIGRPLTVDHLGQQEFPPQATHSRINALTGTLGPAQKTTPHGRFRRGSRELDAEAKRVLETMEGDSLSKRNVEAYLGLLNLSSAFDDSA